MVINEPVPVRFSKDERSGNCIGGGAIRLTDDLQRLAGSVPGGGIADEAEARWRLVETAGSLTCPGRTPVLGKMEAFDSYLDANPYEPTNWDDTIDWCDRLMAAVAEDRTPGGFSRLKIARLGVALSLRNPGRQLIQLYGALLEERTPRRRLSADMTRRWPNQSVSKPNSRIAGCWRSWLSASASSARSPPCGSAPEWSSWFRAIRTTKTPTGRCSPLEIRRNGTAEGRTSSIPPRARGRLWPDRLPRSGRRSTP